MQEEVTRGAVTLIVDGANLTQNQKHFLGGLFYGIF